MSITIIILIIAIHWIADFVFQTDEMAKGKSTNFNTLIFHTSVYSAVWLTVLVLLGIFAGTFTMPYLIFTLKFSFITFLAHTAIDYYTSKVHTKLYEDDKHREFFTSLGFDQLLHYAQLFITFEMLR